MMKTQGNKAHNFKAARQNDKAITEKQAKAVKFKKILIKSEKISAKISIFIQMWVLIKEK